MTDTVAAFSPMFIIVAVVLLTMTWIYMDIAIISKFAQLFRFQKKHKTKGEIPKDGLKLHLDAAKGVTLDAFGNVSVWADQSVNENHAVQESVAARPSPSELSLPTHGHTEEGAVITREVFEEAARRMPNNYAERPSTRTLRINRDTRTVTIDDLTTSMDDPIWEGIIFPPVTAGPFHVYLTPEREAELQRMRDETTRHVTLEQALQEFSTAMQNPLQVNVSVRERQRSSDDEIFIAKMTRDNLFKNRPAFDVDGCEIPVGCVIEAARNFLHCDEYCIRVSKETADMIRAHKRAEEKKTFSFSGRKIGVRKHATKTS